LSLAIQGITLINSVISVIQERFNKEETGRSLDITDFLLIRILYIFENFEENGIKLFVTNKIEILLQRRN